MSVHCRPYRAPIITVSHEAAIAESCLPRRRSFTHQGTGAKVAAAKANNDKLCASTGTNDAHQQIAILDFGSQYSHLIARRVREMNCYCELTSCEVAVADLRAKNLAGIILSGGPFSVYEDGAPHVAPGFWDFVEERGLPVLGICYGMQEMATHFGGKDTVQQSAHREYGHAVLHTANLAGGAGGVDPLFAGLAPEEKTGGGGHQVWMSHGDKLHSLPAGFADVARTANSEHAAISCTAKKLWGIQFHPEVTHTPQGTKMLANFVTGVCACSQEWRIDNLVDEMVKTVQEQVGPTAHVIGAVSGGVDSTVCAVLLQKAIGDRFHAVLVDNGLLRKDEAREVVARMRGRLGINLKCVDASDLFMGKLAGVEDPEAKRKIIGGAFIDVFEAETKTIEGDVQFLLQGTLYPDVIESVSFRGPSVTIKSHHNVGGLPARMKLKLIEPVRELFKDEVRALGQAMGIERESVWRHPFPGPGLGIRVLGAVSKKQCDKLREADAIFLEELRLAGEYYNCGQAMCVLLPCKAVGVMGDGRTYDNVIAVRAVTTSDFMTADWARLPYDLLAKISNRIVNEVKGVTRVVYDITSKPPGTIEWE